MTDPDPPVLAITHADDGMHVGPAVTVLAHVTGERLAASGTAPDVDWEYFDAAGRSLHVDEAGALTPVEPEADPPGDAQRQILVARIGLVLAHAQVRLDALLAAAGGAGPDDPTRMVRVQGDLRAVLVMLAALVPDLDPTPVDPHASSNIFHRLWHAAFG